ncbi:MAG TPA: ABC transporter permease [Candidatus Microsaccharimonas sp.]|jgi:ABC-2 type transport system permease protein
MYNLGTVFRFEVKRTLKKKSFWIMAVAFPVLISLVFMIIFFSNQATNQAAANTKNQKFSFEVTDDSGLINNKLVQAFGASETNSKQAAIDNVISGKLDAYFYYPKDLVTSKVQIYAKDAGLFDNSRYQAVAQVLLQQSVAPTVDAPTTAILQNTVGYNATTYKDGVEFDGFKQLIAPGIFLVLFYILIAMFGNQMLASTTEEKENRVIEMILTTIKARTLIIGKILSLLVLALIQVVTILTPVIIAYAFLHNALSLPNIDLNNIPLDPVRIAIAAVLFLFSFLLFTGLLVAIGAAVPTAKEAAGFFGAIMLCLFGPLYAVTLFISAPDSGLVRFLTFFPLTAPIPLMLRNAVGNLTIPDALVGIIILAVSAVIALAVAIRMFQFGALEYSRRIGLKDILRKK